MKIPVIKYYVYFTLLFYLVLQQNAYAIEVSQYLDEATENNKHTESEKQKWTGIDVSIVGKYAKKYGHPPRDPYINTDQGDLLLFVFTAAGVIGGFIIGYNFRKLFIDEKDNHKKDHHGRTQKITGK